MMMMLSTLTFLLSTLISSEASLWSYKGDSSPEFWSEHFPICGGDSQSPINLASDSPRKIHTWNNYRQEFSNKSKVEKKIVKPYWHSTLKQNYFNLTNFLASYLIFFSINFKSYNLSYPGPKRLLCFGEKD